MARHYFSDTAVSTTLASGISNSATSVVVASASGFPGSFPYFLAFDRGTGSMEVVEVTNAVSTTLTVVRGVSGTSAVSHSSGTPVEHVAPASFYNEDSAHVNSSTGVHGVTGDIVGTTATQTLTGKSMSGALNTFTNILNSQLQTGPTGSIVGTTDTQTLTNKSISGATNTLTAIPVASVTGLTNRLAALETVNSMITYTASGSLTALQATNVRAIRVRVWGGGGSGGGAAATGAGQSSAGAGGGGGGHAEDVFGISGLTFPVTVTIGAGGAAGAAGLAGSNGATTSFGTYVIATGGVAGQAGPAAATVGVSSLGGSGGIGTAGQMLLAGQGGRASVRFAAAVNPPGEGGVAAGGGGGNTLASYPGGAATAAGVVGVAPGGGGGGGYNGASQVAQVGAAGGPGMVVVDLMY